MSAKTTVTRELRLPGQCVITREIAVAEGVFAPGHLGELTQIMPFERVDAVLAECGATQRRLRKLPAIVEVRNVQKNPSQYLNMLSALGKGVVLAEMDRPKESIGRLSTSW